MLADQVHHGAHDPLLVALSVVIAVAAAAAAIDLAGRVAATRGWARVLWLAGGSFAMGFGIWAMHFTGMLAYTLPFPVWYHLPTVILSLVAAILGAGAALWFVSGDRLRPGSALLGSVAMGAAIATMHYVGMAAIRSDAVAIYASPLVATSIALAWVVSGVALVLVFRLRDYGAMWDWRKVAGALTMGAAVPAMHYTAMAAVSFTRLGATIDLTATVPARTLGWAAVAGSAFLVLTIATVSSHIDRRFADQAAALHKALQDVRVLEGLLPICALCKSIRAADGGWQKLEAYVTANSQAQFSHGLCPPCLTTLYGDLADES